MVQPSWIEPELATLTKERFSDPAWISERKLDGERCLAFASGDSVRLLTRNKKSITGTYPELAAALGAQRAGDFIVDGEIVAFDGPQTSFAQLQQRMQLAAPLSELVRRVPVYFYLFDVVYAEDRICGACRCSSASRCSACCCRSAARCGSARTGPARARRTGRRPARRAGRA